MISHILIIDDDSDDLELFSEALQECAPHIMLTKAVDGCEGINHLSDSKPLPDLIFLDINMPKMDGWQCLEQIKNSETLNKIPIYMYSTSSHEEEKQRALNSGATSFITKPNSFKELVKILSGIVND